MTLFKALKLLLKLGEKETLVLGFKSWCGTTKFDTANYLAGQAEKWNRMYCRIGSGSFYQAKIDARHNAKAYEFMTAYLEQKHQVRIKQSTCDHYKV